jgi:hypothetical protein
MDMEGVYGKRETAVVFPAGQWRKVLCRLSLVFALFCACLSGAGADGLAFSGLFDVKSGGGMSDSGEARSGFDAYANLRLQERADTVTFYAAFNVNAVSGMFAATSSGDETPLVGFETERLYLRWAEDRWGLDAGLMPLHLGYGQVFAPSDFLIKKNPAVLDARPRGVLGAALFQYPLDNIKITEFAVFPSGLLASGFQDHHFGAAFETHFASASFQALYAFHAALSQSAELGRSDQSGVHYFGGSLKLEAGIGLLADTLYRYDPTLPFDHEGLAFSAGADYTLGKLYVLAEYLYNGKNSASRRNTGGLFAARAMLGTTFLYTVSDLTNITAQGLWSIDSQSLLPSLVFSHDLMQGFTLSLTAQFPLDLADDAPGELGPDALGQRFSLSAGLRLRL